MKYVEIDGVKEPLKLTFKTEDVFGFVIVAFTYFMAGITLYQGRHHLSFDVLFLPFVFGTLGTAIAYGRFKIIQSRATQEAYERLQKYFFGKLGNAFAELGKAVSDFQNLSPDAKAAARQALMNGPCVKDLPQR